MKNEKHPKSKMSLKRMKNSTRKGEDLKIMKKLIKEIMVE